MEEQLNLGPDFRRRADERAHVAGTDGRSCELCQAEVAGEHPFEPGQRVVVRDGNPLASWSSSFRMPNCTAEWRGRSEVA